ncbi:uncharacterized protein DUF4192 [Saccharopolyspora erythraea NRRL 2338]|uniref:Uncharacterized protein n=2 Tax=Saccharopolyspora erythraea TaxID=1836 RepID=A4FAL5_SACEN|nr:DUF4192 domain-containing protein [Saccharopolyspora erythraea]EQD84357.1 hypothetical protein N599_20490 [Saccharopolyspora erythraea D]PFG94875.1 uncharacterized protein DUF4192 [Saccharopolyspora erythraea NRRL 2338]QRK91577.1 DUF4192 domain-containing protein [Saccharopolyspora erythraea]CAM01090.1 hypothetical protein SACE_1773 [Saccharopolyspora erythraea NRRL 2338]
MTGSLHSTVSLDHLGGILAATPHLLGFRPENSLVLMAVAELSTKPVFGFTLRVDLPPPGHEYEVAEQLLSGAVRSQHADSVVAVVVGERPGDRPPDEPEPPPWDPPHRRLVEVVREILGCAGISVTHAIWMSAIVTGRPWICYDEDECRGVMPDPQISPVGTATAAAGVVTFGNRAEIEALVASEPAGELARRSARLDALTEDLEAEREPHDRLRQDLEFVSAAITRTAQGAALTEDDHLRVLLAVSDPRVRDIVLGTSIGPVSRAAEQLWLTLVRKAPAPELADVAALLAFSAYLRGDRVFAGVVLERAEVVRPEHSLTRLLRQSLEVGLPASKLVVLARDAAEDARTLLQEDGAW